MSGIAEQFIELWASLSAWIETAQAGALPSLQEISAILTIPIVRYLGLGIIVLLTIYAIAWIYGGAAGNGQSGPVALRPHVAQRLSRQDIVIPRPILELGMDGVIATCDIYYVYSDRRQNRKRVRLHTLKHAKIHVSAVRLPRIQKTLFGYEVPDVPAEDVCFPPVEVNQPPTEIRPTPSFAKEYVAQNDIIAKWTEDDVANLISVSPEVLAEVEQKREDFIVARAAQVKRDRERPRFARIVGTKIARRFGDNRGLRQPNVIGSFTVRFRFSKNPLFILSRHPDRDLKMTAWLTVLTSLFAMIMEAWPMRTGIGGQTTPASSERIAKPAARPIPSAP